MLKSSRVAATLLAVCVLCPVLALTSPAAEQTESVIIQTRKPYTQVVSTIAALGGKVKYQYTYIDGIAADVPASAMDALRRAVGSAAIVKDVVMEAPQNMARGASAKGNSATTIPNISSIVAAAPDSYKLNNLGLNVAGLHAGLPPNKPPLTGAGVI